jgi:acyl dehydratase
MPEPFEFPIERSRVAEFRRAVGDVDGPRDLAPPTFVVVADQFDPAFDRRPKSGAPWPPPGGLGTFLHVEQRIEIARPLLVGEHAMVRRLLPRTWQKQGRRGGTLEFIERTTEVVGADGNAILRSAWVDVKPQRSHVSLSTASPEGPPGAPPVGTTVVEDLSRTQIAMYIGVTGDFHPLHHDDAYARDRGYPSVLAPGMLTMAVTALATRTVVPELETAEFAGRFFAQVWPGDQLVANVVPTAAGCDVSTYTQSGVQVFSGTVRSRDAAGAGAAKTR